jgi:hypothetical protein
MKDKKKKTVNTFYSRSHFSLSNQILPLFTILHHPA